MMLLEQLKRIVGPKGWTTDPVELSVRLTEWRGVVNGATPMAVSPASTSEVSAVIRACAEAGVAIVPQGGNTGMCAGAVPDASGTQIILSLARMNQIRSVDGANFSMEVEAGCILEKVQGAADNIDRLFALSLGAEGSCQIGGNLATNAGGINVLRYGTARAQVLGLEVVLADGTVVSSLRSLRKDTAGYDLKQLFIGSEGTLGVITAATLKLFPKPAAKFTALIAIASAGDAVSLLAHIRTELADSIEAFELVSDYVFGLVEQHIPDAKLPFAERAPWYVLWTLRWEIVKNASWQRWRAQQTMISFWMRSSLRMLPRRNICGVCATQFRKPNERMARPKNTIFPFPYRRCRHF